MLLSGKVLHFLFCIGILAVFSCQLLLLSANASNTLTHICSGEEQGELGLRGRAARWIVQTPDRTPVVARKTPDTPSSRTRNTPYFTNLDNQLVNQTPFAIGWDELRRSLSQTATSVFSYVPSPLTVDYLALFIVCANHLSVSPTRLSVQPYTIQKPKTQINTVAIWMMSKSSKA